MSEEKMDLDKVQRSLRDARFLNRMAKYCTVEEQMDKVEKECEDLGVDVRDTFHVVGTKQKGEKTVLHIVTSGKEGEESARQTLTDLAEAVDVDIENESAKRYDEREREDREFVSKMIERKLEDLYAGYHKKRGLKGRWL